MYNVITWDKDCFGFYGGMVGVVFVDDLTSLNEMNDSWRE